MEDEPPAQRARRGAAPGDDDHCVEDLVSRLAQTKSQVKHVTWLGAKAADYGQLAPGLLPPAVLCVLARAGALPLYSHQVEAITAALHGDSVVVSTPTASGKSVCFLAPLLTFLSDNSDKNVDPANPALLTLHAAAAALEVPLTASDAPMFGGIEVFSEALRRAAGLGMVEFVPPLRMYRCKCESPAQGIALRSSLSREVVELHDQSKLVAGQLSAASLVEKIEKQHVHYKVHVGALFFHRESVFEVRTLDLQAAHFSGADVVRSNEGCGVALGVRREGECGEVTTALDTTAACVLGVLRRRSAAAAQIFLGRLHVQSHVTGFFRKNVASNKVTHKEDYPPPGMKALDLETDGCWLELPQELVTRLQPSGELMSAAHGVKNLMLSLIPGLVACDAADISVVLVGPGGPVAPLGQDPDHNAQPVMYFYDLFGGVGICGKIFEQMERLLADVGKVMDRCPCMAGCASCTHAGRSGVDKKAGESKAASKVIVQSLLGAWMMARGAGEAEPLAEDERAADDEC